MSTVISRIKKSAELFSSRIALAGFDDGEIQRISYKKMNDRIDELARGFKKIGLGKGDKVAIFCPNCPEWALTDLAMMNTGIISVPLHTTLSSKAIQHILNDSRARALIVYNQVFLDRIRIIFSQLNHLESIIMVSPFNVIKELRHREYSLWEIIKKGQEYRTQELDEVSADDMLSIVYTSGTTGSPKGVVLTHRNILTNIDDALEMVPINEKDVLLSFMPLSHILERTAGYYTPLIRGAAIYYNDKINHLARNLGMIRPTILIAVPRIFEKTYDKIFDKAKKGNFIQKFLFFKAVKCPMRSYNRKLFEALVFKKIRRVFGGRIRFVVSGGASLNISIAKFFKSVGIKIMQGYGLTETSPVISVNPLEGENKLGTVGRILKSVEVKISPDKEILVKGKSVFSLYFNNPEATSEAFNEEGYFKTGDLGFLDSEGYLTIIGRKKEIIVLSTGKNVAPHNVEDVLNLNKYISQAAVFGNQKKYIMALIVPDWQELSAWATKNEIHFQNFETLLDNQQVHAKFQQEINEINKGLNEWERVARFYLVKDEFKQELDEVTPTLKLRRHVIEGRYKEEIEKLYN